MGFAKLRIPGAAAQTRVVSVAEIRLGSWESSRPFKRIICDDISEFESHMPSHAVGSLYSASGLHVIGVKNVARTANDQFRRKRRGRMEHPMD